MLIIVNILKIIGGLIALLILLLIAVFTVPVFYRADIDYDSKLNVNIRFVFFLGLFMVYISTVPDKRIRFRVFGIPFYLRKRKKKDRSKAKKIRKKNKRKAEEEQTPAAVHTEQKTGESIKELSDNTPNKKKPEANTKIKISERLQKLKSTIKTSIGKIKDAADKLKRVRDIIRDEEVRAVLGETKVHFLKLFKHASPQKTDLVLSIGFDDPADTGFFLAAVSAFYPIYARWLRIDSHFDEKILKVKGSVRGHFINFYIGWQVFGVIRNEKIRAFLSKNK